MTTPDFGEHSEHPNRSSMRQAGGLYLAACALGPFAFVYVPDLMRVRADAASTMRHLADGPTLLRAGVLAELGCAVLLVFAAGALRRLFLGVDRWHADLMWLLACLVCPLTFVGAALQMAALAVANGALGTVDGAPFALLLLEVHRVTLNLANVFWGLWIVPLGSLVMRCGFIPRWIGWSLVAGGVAYIVTSVASVAAPQLVTLANPAAVVLGGLSELSLIVWLLVARRA